MDFKSALIQDQFSRLENIKLTEIIDINDLKKIDITKSISLYPNIGENLDFINENVLDFKFIYRKIDLISYKFCNKGYFNFKKNIGQILKSVGI